METNKNEILDNGVLNHPPCEIPFNDIIVNKDECSIEFPFYLLNVPIDRWFGVERIVQVKLDRINNSPCLYSFNHNLIVGKINLWPENNYFKCKILFSDNKEVLELFEDISNGNKKLAVGISYKYLELELINDNPSEYGASIIPYNLSIVGTVAK